MAAFKPVVDHSLNPAVGSSTISALDAFVYRSNKLSFNIEPSQNLRVGDRVVLEFGYPYNDILMFNAYCSEHSATAIKIYCVPFWKSGQLTTDVGLYAMTLTQTHSAGSPFVLRILDQWNP